MNKEEKLLIPRYKVKAPYFHMAYKVGDIIEVSPNDKSVHLTTFNLTNEFGEDYRQENFMPVKELDSHPHLFELLPWWAERQVEEMPEYVKRKDDSHVMKVDDYDFESDTIYVGISDGCYNFPLTLSTLLSTKLPATEEEYNTYIKQKKA